jgi:hypothetical protein
MHLFSTGREQGSDPNQRTLQHTKWRENMERKCLKMIATKNLEQTTYLLEKF